MARPRHRPATETASTAPEGGWGWVVLFGMAIVFISTTGHYTAFGLLFGDFLDKLDAKTTGATIIMNSLTAAVNFTGLVTNYLLRTMPYRIVALIGGLLFSVGLMLTVVADSMIQVVITYSIIAGAGLGLLAPSSYLAFNYYFIEKRPVAMGICEAAIGLGFMISPPFCQYLLEQYSFRGTMLLLGGIALHSLVGAMLFWPVTKRTNCTVIQEASSNEMEIVSLENPNNNSSCVHGQEDYLCMAVIPEEEDDLTSDQPNNIIINKTNGMTQVSSQDTECDEHIVISRRGSLVMSAMLDYRTHRLLALDEESQNGSMYDSTTGIIKVQDSNRLNKRPMSGSLTNYGSPLLMFDNSITLPDSTQPDNSGSGYQRKKRPIIKRVDVETSRSLLGQIPDDDLDEAHQSESTDYVKKTCLYQHVFQAFSHFFDLSLFSDIVFLNIVFGLSLSFVSDSNFFTMYPFFLMSKGFSGSDIALCISVASGADVVSRLALPWVSRACNVTPRTSYLLACLSSAIARSIFVSMSDDFVSLAVMSGLIGFLKGGMVVNLSITIGQHCSNEKFAGAYSIFMVITGIFTLSIGSFVGMLSFPFVFHVLSMGLMLCALTWLVEYMLRWEFQKISFIHTIKRVFCK